MRKIKLNRWKAKIPELDKEGNVVGSKDVEEDLLTAFNNLVASKKPEEIPRGIDKFRIFGKIAEAFDKAIKTNMLELDEREYKFLKELLEADVPSVWALNKNLQKAINDFLNAKEE